MPALGVFDEHGTVDLLDEIWLDLSFENGLTYASIEGASINTALKGMFLLHSQSKSSRNLLPGGVSAWRESAPVVFVTLFHVATVIQLITRVRVLLLQHYDFHRGALRGLSAAKEAELDALVEGSLIFLTCLVVEFRIHVCMSDLLELRDATENFADLCAPVEGIKALHAKLMEILDEATKSGAQGLLADFAEQNADNEALMPKLERTIHRAVATFRKRETVAPPVNMNSNNTATSTVDNFIEERVDVFGVHEARQSNGIWEGDDSDSDAEWVGVADEGDEKSANEGANNSLQRALSSMTKGADSNDNEERKVADDRPDVLIEDGQCLAERVVPFLSPQLASEPRSIWSFDVIEIARQWTMLDSKLYRRIELSQLIVSDGDGIIQCNWELPRYMEGAKGVREFIDRFDAEALWVSHSVLTPSDGDESPGGRSRVVMYMVGLAQILMELNNFSGMMAILTGLQQTAIRRLSETWRLVPQDSLATLDRLKAVMATRNNFSSYRDEFARRFEVFGDSTGAEIYFSKFNDDQFGQRTASTMSSYRGSNVLEHNEQAGLDEGGSAIIPHLGAHLTELLGVVEGNGQYLDGNPCLLNFTRLKHISNSLSMLGRAQELTYNLRYLRLVASVINLEVGKFVALNEKAANEMKNSLWELSNACEGGGAPSNIPSRSRSHSGAFPPQPPQQPQESQEPQEKSAPQAPDGFMKRMFSSRQ